MCYSVRSLSDKHAQTLHYFCLICNKNIFQILIFVCISKKIEIPYSFFDLTIDVQLKNGLATQA